MQTAASFFVALFVMHMASGATAAPDRDDRRPNVLLVITDDQRLDSFGFLRGKALTPAIDRLAAEGVYFSRGYVPSSVCTPSRYTCLTGRYASRAQSENFRRCTTPEGQTCVQWNTELRPEDSTLPKVLRRAGYVTGMVGKWHNGGGKTWSGINRDQLRDADPADPQIAQILTDAQAALHQQIGSCGFDYVASANLGNFASHPCRALRYHNPEWITRGAIDFIEQNKDRPFFLYMATTLLHGPDPLESLKADPRVTHAGLLDEPLRVQPSRRSVLQRAKAAGIHERLAPATWLDDGIGAVLRKLDQLGLARDTLVIFLNDHGVEQGKGSCYEGGVRTPVIIRWKDRIEPGRSDALIQSIDLAPTILEACGIASEKGDRSNLCEAPSGPSRQIGPVPFFPLDGRSLLPLVAGKTDEVHPSLYFEIGHTRAVCTRRWKYLAFRIPPSRQLTDAQRQRLSQRYAESKRLREDKPFEMTPDAPLSHMGFPGGQNTERGNAMRRYKGTYYDADQLYDLTADPGEQNNLADDPAHQAALARMKALLAEHLSGVPGTFAEFKPAGE